jgi:hypothetical protein
MSEPEAVKFCLLNDPLPYPIPVGTPRPAWFEPADDEVWVSISNRFRQMYRIRLDLIVRAVASDWGRDFDTLTDSDINWVVEIACRTVPALTNGPFGRVPATDVEQRNGVQFVVRRDNPTYTTGRPPDDLDVKTQMLVIMELALRQHARKPMKLNRPAASGLSAATGQDESTLRKRIAPELATAADAVGRYYKARRNIEIYGFIHPDLVSSAHYDVPAPTPRQMSFMQGVVPMLQRLGTN